MKMLYIGHTYIPEENREKLYFLNKKAEVQLITPKRWKHQLKFFFSEQDKKINHKNLNTIFNGFEKIYFYFPSIGMGIRKFKPDIIHVEQGTDSLSYFQAIVAKKMFCPKAKIVGFTWMNLDYKNLFPLSLIEKFNIRNTDYLICGNRDAEKIMRKKGYTGTIKIMPQLGVDPKLHRKMNVSSLKGKLNLGNSFVMGFFGRLVEEKGLLTLFDTLKCLKGEWKLLLIGRGNLKPELIRKSKEYGFEYKVKFLDTVPHKEIPKYMNCLDAYVLPSETTPKWKEQFGRVLIEAMACEVPVIGSDSGEIPNVIGDAGLIFKEGDSRDLREKIEYLMENKRAREKYAKLGRERVLKKYTHKILADKIYGIYKELLDKN